MSLLTSKTKIAQLLGKNSYEGDMVGVEVEMEMHGYFDLPLSSNWKHDPNEESIKGYSCEMLTKSPILREDLPKILAELYNSVKGCGSTIKPSMRASSHVHLNMTDRTLSEYFKFALLYHLFETVLVQANGESRQGNLFCIRARDAEDVYDNLTKIFKGKSHPLNSYMFNPDNRYGSLNYNALSKFGTAEFRSLITTPDLSNIIPWVDTLYCLRDFAVEQGRIFPLLEEALSGKGDEILRNILGNELYSRYDSPKNAHRIADDARMLLMPAHFFDKATL